MENEGEKRLNKRIDSIEGRVAKNEDKIDRIDEKINIIDDKHDNRHLDIVRLTTKLQGSSENTERNTERMANSIEGLVNELKQSNSRTDDRFNQVNEEVRMVRDKIDSKEKDREYNIAEKALSNKTVVAIIAGGAGVLTVVIQILGPLFFG